MHTALGTAVGRRIVIEIVHPPETSDQAREYDNNRARTVSIHVKSGASWGLEKYFLVILAVPDPPFTKKKQQNY
jgi:hypothetical protein